MSEFRGTPGPYDAHIPAPDAIERPWVSGSGYQIADVMGGGPLPVIEARANAHLLAASWEMYEALWQLDAYLDFDTPWTKGEVFGDPSGINEAMKQAKAAIAKALGEQP